MQYNNEKSKVYNTGRGITGQALLYQHMSNHYRRILNAKKSVDTAPPATYKPRRSNTCTVSSSPVRSFTSNNKRFSRRNVSPALTDRTGSNYSNGGSCCGAESYYARKCQNSQNNECCCRARLDVNPDVSDMELINQIAFDTKRGPADCFDASWKDAERSTNFSRFRSPYETKKSGNRAIISGSNKKSGSKSKLPALKRKLSQKDKASSDLMEKHSKFFISHNNSFCPRILKTNATSRIKSLKVYHPPRKRNGTTGGPQWKEEEEKAEEKGSMEPVDMMKSNCNGTSSGCHNTNSNSNCKCKQTVNARESQTSSRDSAYNGGVSSLPESRSPTPDQRNQKSCPCCGKETDAYYENVRKDGNIVVPNLKLTESQNTQTEPTQTSDRKISQSNEQVRDDGCEHMSRPKRLDFKQEECPNRKNSANAEERDYFKRKIKEEALYTNFIRDITAEVLEKGLYTNKALKKVMKRHVLSNLWLLDKDRMLKEIDKLRVQLGIPEDEELMDIKLENNGSVADTEECYSVISDSQLTESSFQPQQESGELTKRKRHPQTDKHAPGPDKPFPKSISDVMHQSDESNEIVLDTESDDEDEELISVIHVTKMVKDKKRSESHMKDMFSNQSRNATQGMSADESEQSSDHVTRKKKPHTRFRKTEKTSSSSSTDDLESNIVNNKRFYGSKLDGGGTGKSHSPKKRDVTLLARRSGEPEVDGSNE